MSRSVCGGLDVDHHASVGTAAVTHGVFQQVAQDPLQARGVDQRL
jgi:hypothetical protein